MAEKHSRPLGTTRLQERTEAITPAKAPQPIQNPEAPRHDETRRIHRDLQTEQIKPEIQSRVVHRTSVELDAKRDHSWAFYGLASEGYIAISKTGLILETNPTTAASIGIARDALLQQPFTRFLHDGDKDRFHRCQKLLFESGDPQVCELRWLKKDGNAFWTRLEATLAADEENVPFCRAVISDITELKKTEDALHESEERLRTILQTTMEGFLLADAQGRLLEVNETYCRMSGYSEKDLLAMSLSDLEANETAGETAAHIKKVMLLGEDRFESRHRRKNGSLFDIEISTQYQHSGNGRFVIFGRDITERKRAWEALNNYHETLEQRVRERTAELLIANQKLMEEIDTRRRKEEITKVCLLVSEFAAAHSLDELTQKALDEIERMTESRIGFFHFLEEDQRTISRQTWSTSTLKSFCKMEGRGQHFNVDKAGVWADCIRQHRPVIHNNHAVLSLSDRRRLPPGHVTVVRELVVPIIRRDKIVAIIGVGNKGYDYDARDLSTVSDLANMAWEAILRKQAEERMFDSFAHLTTVIDGISDPLIMLDANHEVKRINKAARDYYGLNSFQDAVGKPCYEAFQGRSSACEGCEHPFSNLEGCSKTFERRGEMDPERIEQVFVDMTRDEAGTPNAYIIRIHDITQAKMADRHLLQNEKLASLGLLVAGIAHEINNPNNFIYFNTPILRSYLQFLLPIVDEYVSGHPDLLAFGRPYPVFREDCFKLLDNIEHGSTRINQIVGNLREYVRERGKGEVRRIDLKPVLEKAISICMGRIRKAVKSFEWTIPETLPALHADPLAVEQVVVNLLINAAQAANKTESWVRLTVIEQKEPDNEIVIEVRDNGSGMDSETQRKLFDPFFTTKAMGVGTGLGMSISHRLVTEAGGRIEFQSEVDQGSTFRVRLKNTSPQSV